MPILALHVRHKVGKRNGVFLTGRIRHIQAQPPGDDLRQVLLLKEVWQGINAFRIGTADHLIQRHIAVETDFFADLALQGLLGAADHNIGLNPDFEQFFHTMLGRLAFLLSRGLRPRHHGDVREHDVVAPLVDHHFPCRLEKVQVFNIANRSPHLDQDQVVRTLLGFLAE